MAIVQMQQKLSNGGYEKIYPITDNGYKWNQFFTENLQVYENEGDFYFSTPISISNEIFNKAQGFQFCLTGIQCDFTKLASSDILSLMADFKVKGQKEFSLDAHTLDLGTAIYGSTNFLLANNEYYHEAVSFDGLVGATCFYSRLSVDTRNGIHRYYNIVDWEYNSNTDYIAIRGPYTVFPQMGGAVVLEGKIDIRPEGSESDGLIQSVHAVGWYLSRE